MPTPKTPQDAAIALLTSNGYAVLTSEEAGELTAVRELIPDDLIEDVYKDEPSARRAYERAWRKLDESDQFGG
jgi:hypothetical protein